MIPFIKKRLNTTQSYHPYEIKKRKVPVGTAGIR